MADFFPGQRVYCVRGNWEMRAYRMRLNVPIEGREYVVRSTMIDQLYGLGLRLHWLVNEPRPFIEGQHEPTFAVRGRDGVANFLPLVDDDAEISTEKKRTRPKQLEPA